MPYKDIEKRRQACRESTRRRRAIPEIRAEELRRMREYRRAHPEKMKTFRRKYRLANLYGMTLQGYEEMVERQEGRCAICKNLMEYDGAFTLHVDHDHKTGIVRGLLCGLCNGALSLIEKDPEWGTKAKEYLGV